MIRRLVRSVIVWALADEIRPVVIHRVEVASEDPDRFVLGLVNSLRNPPTA
jgi:hypothetical protein